MNYHKNEKGIALVMALILSLIALAIVSALVFMVTQGSSVSGLMKRYETAKEAAKAGEELFVLAIVDETFRGTVDLVGKYSALTFRSLPPYASGCLQTKLSNQTSDWGACSIPPDPKIAFDPKTSPDMTFTLAGPDPADHSKDFNVFLKIVDTVGGNTDISGLGLEGTFGVVEGGPSSVIMPAAIPYMFRVEIQAEQNPQKAAIVTTGRTVSERANLSVLYAY
jgi:hypothetical protein